MLIKMDKNYFMYQGEDRRYNYASEDSFSEWSSLEGVRILHRNLPGSLSEVIEIVCNMLNHEYDCLG